VSGGEPDFFKGDFSGFRARKRRLLAEHPVLHPGACRFDRAGAFKD